VLNIYGNEIRTFQELIPRSTLLKIDEEIDKILAIKKVVKVGGTMNILIRDYTEEKDKRSGKYKIKKEEIKKMLITTEVVEINKHDTFDFNYLIGEFESRFTQADYASVEEGNADPGNVDTIGDLLKPDERPIKDRSRDSINTYTNGLSESGFLLYRYLDINLEIFSVNSVRGSCYIPTPEKYSNPKCGLINIKNDDNECFKWCMLYHQSKQEKIAIV
jgi:hypothetical protein